LESSRVVGGNTTKPGTFPSAALLGRMVKERVVDSFAGTIQIKEKLRYICGGTLINRSENQAN
jgi:hypothetical protein